MNEWKHENLGYAPCKEHIHCWHRHEGPIWMVIPNGHVVQKCCKCPAMRTMHRDHACDWGK
jgi:hypothetical protein